MDQASPARIIFYDSARNLGARKLKLGSSSKEVRGPNATLLLCVLFLRTPLEAGGLPDRDRRAAEP